MKNLSALLLAALIGLPALGCSDADGGATPEGAEDLGLASNEEELSSCGAAKYNQALAHYKNAVVWSKERLAKGVCESDNGFQWQIADEASLAVMTCGHFRGIIKTSTYAAPIRKALAPSLTLRSLTGELAVIRDSSWQNWTGVEKLFPGLSFWAQAQGAYGSPVRIDFKAGGKATWGAHAYNEQTGEITWQTTEATYTLAKTDKDKSPRTVTVVHGGQTETFSLKVQNPYEANGAPLFVLESNADAQSATPRLYSLVSECDA